MKIRFLMAALVAAVMHFSSVQATTVRALDLEELVADSALVFEGTCLGNRTEREASTGMVVTYTTFAVHDALKGEVGSTHTIKQVGGNLDDGRPVFRIQGVPKFAPGQDYVVFLTGASTLGFSSPLGLSQGRFSITREGGVPKVANGRDFRELVAGLHASGRAEEALARLRSSPAVERHMDLADFKALVRERAGAAK
jgi:hypothetical protein